MNLSRFLKQVDIHIQKLSPQDLASFLHEVARTLPERQREEFLDKLTHISSKKDPAIPFPSEKASPGDQTCDAEKICQEFPHFKRELQQIEDGDIALVGTLNEEYDDWYDSSDDEFIFEDPQNVLGIIQKTCEFIHQCTTLGRYEECRELAEQLMALHIAVEGDYADYGNESLSLTELEEEELGDFDYSQLTLDLLYAVYQLTPLENRPQALHQVFFNACCPSVTLEALMQEGRGDLDRFPEFLELWIDYLGARKGQEEHRLLSEALALRDVPDGDLVTARRFSATHPGLYEQILSQNPTEKNPEESLAIGQEALESLPQNYVIRSRIALLTATCALRSGNQTEAEKCWLEAFRSDTRPIHYLRLAAESLDFSRHQKEVREISRSFRQMPKPEYLFRNQSDELQENISDKKNDYALAFFDGEFDYVIQEGMNRKSSLGWSGTFMKCGIALFLLYLYEGTALPVGCQNMCTHILPSIAFTEKEYSQGLLQPVGTESNSLFWQCFCKWRPFVPMSAGQQAQILDRLSSWIQARTDGIMQGNYRNHYRECAALIAALGEVRESRGEPNEKARLMDAYRTAYSRRSAFRRELTAFGLK